ncbi:MAG: PAS domain-containing sensor histidine kinase, partial [Sulfurimonas sp.]|nr:PAS domain-containing sensor histidine kinase [Sulfurimonas sp.]
EVKKIVHELQVHQIELELQNEELLSVQKELERTKKRYFDLYDMAPLGYCTISKDDAGLIQEVNVAASSLLGIERNQVMKLSIFNFIFQEDQDIFYFFHKKIYMSDTDEQHVCELRMQKKNGMSFWVRLSASSYVHDDNTPLVLLIISDINEIKKKELVFESETQNNMLFLQSKYASMGETVGNIAHQWKQPLNAIGSIQNSIKASLIFKGEIPKEKLLQSVETSFKLLQHLSETIDTFYGFLSQENSSNNNFLIADEFETIRKITEYSFYNSNIKLIFELHSNPTIEGNANEFTHAMLNLILNSKNALDNLEPDAPIITVTVTNEEKNCVIRVLDNAGGILIEPIESIFDWHISSKENSSGIGLYITKNIIEKRFGGTIKVKNREHGVCFTIELPSIKHDENSVYIAKPYEKSTLEQMQRLSKKIIELEEPEKHSK